MTSSVHSYQMMVDKQSEQLKVKTGGRRGEGGGGGRPQREIVSECHK
jgi:hypothetical protein